MVVFNQDWGLSRGQFDGGTAMGWLWRGAREAQLGPKGQKHGAGGWDRLWEHRELRSLASLKNDTPFHREFQGQGFRGSKDMVNS